MIDRSVFISLFLLLLVIAGCGTSSRQKPWKKLDCGLYLSPAGELGFASDPEIANVPKSQLAPERCENVFITYLGTEQEQRLIDVVDTMTFKALGNGYYRDKRHIYQHHAICESGYLLIMDEKPGPAKQPL